MSVRKGVKQILHNIYAFYLLLNSQRVPKCFFFVCVCLFVCLFFLFFFFVFFVFCFFYNVCPINEFNKFIFIACNIKKYATHC